MANQCPNYLPSFGNFIFTAKPLHYIIRGPKVKKWFVVQPPIKLANHCQKIAIFCTGLWSCQRAALEHLESTPGSRKEHQQFENLSDVMGKMKKAIYPTHSPFRIRVPCKVSPLQTEKWHFFIEKQPMEKSHYNNSLVLGHICAICRGPYLQNSQNGMNTNSDKLRAWKIFLQGLFIFELLFISVLAVWIVHLAGEGYGSITCECSG